MSRVLFVYDYPESGSERVLKEYAKYMAPYEVDCLCVDLGKGIPSGYDLSCTDYEWVHFWNIRTFEYFKDQICVPYGVTIHHIYPGQEQAVVNALTWKIMPTWVHAMDNFTEQNLGRYGVSCFVTPQIIDVSDIKREAPCLTPNLSSLGGNSDGFKRFEVVEGAALLLGIPARLHDSSAKWISRKEVLEFLRGTYIYVNACFGCCGPIPPQEALLMGRPLVTTRTTTMLEILRQGLNGEFFDGSPEGCVRVVRKIMSRYEQYCGGAAYHTMPINSERVAQVFVKRIKEALEHGA